jgi:hypothetical protein
MAQILLGYPTHGAYHGLFDGFEALGVYVRCFSANSKYATRADVREEVPSPPGTLRFPIIVPSGQYLNSSTGVDYITVQGDRS